MLFRHLSTILAMGFPPYLWFVGWEHSTLASIYLIAVGVIKLIEERGGRISSITWMLVLTPILLGILTLLAGPQAGLYYPVAVNIGLLLIFFTSLLSPPTVIQRIAEIVAHEPLDSIAIRYTRGVTQVWCLFFILNASVAMCLAYYQMMSWWVLYNGVIAYGLIGILLGGEWLLRRRIQQKIRCGGGLTDG